MDSYIHVHLSRPQLCQKEAERKPIESTSITDNNNPESVTCESDKDDKKTVINIGNMTETTRTS